MQLVPIKIPDREKPVSLHVSVQVNMASVFSACFPMGQGLHAGEGSERGNTMPPCMCLCHWGLRPTRGTPANSRVLYCKQTWLPVKHDFLWSGMQEVRWGGHQVEPPHLVPWVQGVHRSGGFSVLFYSPTIRTQALSICFDWMCAAIWNQVLRMHDKQLKQYLNIWFGWMW